MISYFSVSLIKHRPSEVPIANSSALFTKEDFVKSKSLLVLRSEIFKERTLNYSNLDILKSASPEKKWKSSIT